MIMTNREAIKTLDEMGGCCSTDREYVACHIAIDAIEKQIPMKPIKEKYVFYCKNCGGNNDCLMYDGNLADKYNYCANCGQALDWNEV